MMHQARKMSEIMKEMAERSGGMYKASAGSVYPTLQQLEDDSLVTSRAEGGRRTFGPRPFARFGRLAQGRCAASAWEWEQL